MTALLVVLVFVGFIGIDIAVRAIGHRLQAARERRERAAVLQSVVRLEFADGVKSLTRAELAEPRARILAVDDEPVVLDSFRKILVLAGYGVDTVETGPEALTLLRDRDYDFLFTDLKMPDMDGVEVVRAARHLRPDVDVAVITGFGSIETAVETMSQGAADYVQKPFTEEELVGFANRLLIKRQARLEAQRQPTVRIVAPELAETVAGREYCIPGGAFVAPGHTWAQVEAAGQVWVGLDDFGRKLLQRIDRVEMPAPGARVRRGDVLFVARHGGEQVRLRTPVSGEVVHVNPELQREPGLLVQSPYDRGWVCVLEPSDLAADLEGLRIGAPVVAWYQDEVMRLRSDGEGPDGKGPGWSDLEREFFAAGPARPGRRAAAEPEAAPAMSGPR